VLGMSAEMLTYLITHYLGSSVTRYANYYLLCGYLFVFWAVGLIAGTKAVQMWSEKHTYVMILEIIRVAS